MPKMVMGERFNDLIMEERLGEETCLAPRVILISDNRLLLVRYKDTRWYGLPGGKVKRYEEDKSQNLLSAGSFATLEREVFEEAGERIGEELKKSSVCLGITEVVQVRDGLSRMIFSPIFACVVNGFSAEGFPTRLAKLNEQDPGPLFPDARMAITRLKRKGVPGELVKPEFLNPEGKLVYVNFDEEEPRVQFGRH